MAGFASVLRESQRPRCRSIQQGARDGGDGCGFESVGGGGGGVGGREGESQSSAPLQSRAGH